MKIDDTSPNTAVYVSTFSTFQLPSDSNDNLDFVNIEANKNESKNNRATLDLIQMKKDISNSLDLGIAEKQSLLSKLEEQLMAQYVKSTAEKEEPVQHNPRTMTYTVNQMNARVYQVEGEPTRTKSEKSLLV